MLQDDHLCVPKICDTLRAESNRIGRSEFHFFHLPTMYSTIVSTTLSSSEVASGK